MGRQKQTTPLRREVSSEYVSAADRTPRHLARGRSEKIEKEEGEEIPVPGHENGTGSSSSSTIPIAALLENKQAGLPQLVMAVGGIYASFLTWALLQERLTTTPYGADNEVFKFPVFLNTIQSLFAALTGYTYLLLSRPLHAPTPSIIPHRALLTPLLLIALSTSLASPLGYASLAHIDYITFILAKSCKLLPVMFLHITLFGRAFPLYKYLVVLAVTAGVAVFTLHASSGQKHKFTDDPSSAVRNRTWGMLLLSANLLLDGLTNTTQDYIFTTFKTYTGPQMMCANNLVGTALTVSWLALSPLLAHTGAGEYLGMDLLSSSSSSGSSSSEFLTALTFLSRHPRAWLDVLGFSACGAVGQVFIFYTLAHFSSVLLVTVTVTRKMMTMILSVLWFGHRLSTTQWLGVALVFGGVGAEGIVQRREKLAKKAKAKKAAGVGEGYEKAANRGGVKEVLEDEVRAAARGELVVEHEQEQEGKKEL